MNTSRINPRILVLVLALAGVAGYAAYTHWQTERQSAHQRAEITGWQQRWQENTNAVTTAKAAEHEEALEGFMKVDQVRWKLSYDRGKQKNFVEVRARNPLRYHRVSFGLNFEGQTETWKKNGRQAEPRTVSLDVVVKALKPGEGQVVYVPFGAEVPTRAIAWWGKAMDWFRWGGLPTVEPPIESETVQVRVYAEQAVRVEEANQQVARVIGK